jgi:hypothetical protein
MAQQQSEERHGNAASNESQLVGKCLEEGLTIGMPIRRERYAVVHDVVTTTWTETMEAYVFEPRNRNQKRFFAKNILPKLRKPARLVREMYWDNFHVIICRPKEETETELQDTTTAKDSKLDNVVTYGGIVAELQSQSQSLIQPFVNPEMDSGTAPLVKVLSTYFKYCRSAHRPIPTFQGGVFAKGACNYSQEVTLGEIAEDLDISWEGIEGVEGVDSLASGQHQAPSGFEPLPEPEIRIEPTGGRSLGGKVSGPKRARRVPSQHDFSFILKLAEMIAMEYDLHDSDDRYQPGYRFYVLYIATQPALPAPGKGFDEAIARYIKWTKYLRRVVKNIPTILEDQTVKREQVWKLSIPKAVEVFQSQFSTYDNTHPPINSTDANRGSALSLHQWASNLDWIVENNFEDVSPEEVKALKRSFGDGEYTSEIRSWMLRLEAYVCKNKWSMEERGKTSKNSPNLDPVLVRMIQSFTCREIIVGMTPLLETMQAVAESNLQAWERAMKIGRNRFQRETAALGSWKLPEEVLED